MSILSAHDLGLAHGGFDVFRGISLAIPKDARIGLVGPNGIGKTTLLRVLAGVTPPSSGAVFKARGLRMGYLRQEAVEAFAGREHSIFAEMLTVFARLREQAAQLREMEARLEAGEAHEDLLESYGNLQHAFEAAGGYDYELRIGQVLEGLGFAQAQWETPMSHLSGGQKTRALLARLLLEGPDLLILDEPTNHLDVGAVEWLENTLRVWKGALLVVSHDRYFLDTVVDHIWEMSRLQIVTYRGTYSAYVQQRQERWELHKRVYEEEKERLEKELDFIKKNIAGQRVEMAKGRLKRLSAELAAVEGLGPLGLQGKRLSEMSVGAVHMMSLDEAATRLKEFRGPSDRPPSLHMRLRVTARGGNIVLRTKGLRVGYPGGQGALFEAQDIELHRKECAALIGPNGAGKTTFLRTVLGHLEPLAGEVRLGANLKVGYFAQAHDALNPDNTVIDELIDHKHMTVPEARGYLAHYMFRGEDVWKPVRALSGGERGRLALAMLAVEGANFLLLDEPTNHLDIPAQEILQEGLEAFEGTLLLVSHDRYLIDRLATQIWEVRDGRLHVFGEPYREFAAWREREAAKRKAEAAQQRVAAPSSAEQRGDPPTGAGGRQGAAPGAREARKRAEAVAALEAQIAEAEELLALRGRWIQEEGATQSYQDVARMSQEYAATEQRLAGLMEEWSALAAE